MIKNKEFIIGAVIFLTAQALSDAAGNFIGRDEPEGPIKAPWDMILFLIWCFFIIFLVWRTNRRWPGLARGFWVTAAIMLAIFFIRSIINRG